MQKLKSPAGLCAAAGLALGLAFGRYRAAALLGAELWENWPLVIPVLILAVLSLQGKDTEWTPRPPAARILALVSACILYAAAALALLDRSGPFGLIPAIFPTLAGFGIILSASDKGGDLIGMCSVVPVFYQGYLLLQLYRANATDTHRAVFALELFCVIAILLAVYGAASLRFLPYGQLRNCMFGGLGLYAAGLMLRPCLLAGEYVFGLDWMNGTLLLAQAGLALHAASTILWPPAPDLEEDEEDEEDEEEEESHEEESESEAEPEKAE